MPAESEEDRYKYFPWRDISLAEELDQFVSGWREIAEADEPPPWEMLRERWRRGALMTDEQMIQMMRRYHRVWKHTKKEVTYED